MATRKLLTLNNALHVLEIGKNLVSNSLLNKFLLIFESDKVIISKSDMYMGKVYKCNGLFNLNMMTIINKENSSPT